VFPLYFCTSFTIQYLINQSINGAWAQESDSLDSLQRQTYQRHDQTHLDFTITPYPHIVKRHSCSFPAENRRPSWHEHTAG